MSNREELRKRANFVNDLAQASRAKDVDLKKYLGKMKGESA